MCLISSRDDDDFLPARQVHVYRDGRVSREYVSSPRRSYVSTPSLVGARTRTTRVRHVYHSPPRGSLASFREPPGVVVWGGRRGGYY
ncbi:hypothetical protein L873DRAFT_1679646 [Choiromyces venosus 120613-1]|uniref:Uncharacterized protein n=1 Tax=Choiromyces venosus 120613-1 TaxID=1336337 RepID=A0A3N4JR10_9PEZI|nr:hypothetical protein L873DRAFT_1679646 [Choiromyces venosus 120613-1]